MTLASSNTLEQGLDPLPTYMFVAFADRSPVQHITKRNRIKQRIIRVEVMFHLLNKMLGSRKPGESFREEIRSQRKRISLANWNLIAGKKERNRDRDRKPYKEGRVVGVVSAVVILAPIVPSMPVTGAVPSVGVVPLTPVGVVPITPASVVPITPVIVAVEISVTAGMNSGVTGMDGASLRRGNSDDGEQDKAQGSYGFHGIYHYSVN